MNSIPDLCARRALLTPQRTALRDLPSGRTLTYAQLHERAGRCAALLASHGVDEGDRVAVLCRNRPEFFELLFACARLGAVLVPLNWRMPPAELMPLLQAAQPGLLLCGAEDAGAADASAQGAGCRILNFDSDYAAARDAMAPLTGRSLWPADEPWYLLYTSGTTGAPKAVIQTYGMAIANYVNISQGMAIQADDVTLNYLPLFHTAGINLVTLPTLLMGGTALIMPAFDIARCLELIAAGALDTFFGVPAVYQQIALDPGFAQLDLRRIRSWGCGGAPLPEPLIERYLEQGARICNGMGMTETGPTVFLMDPAAVADKIGSVGKPQLLAAVRIVDDAGNDVADGATGEVWFAGPNVTPGYWQRPDANAQAFAADGWLRSGDLARRDEDGYYYVVGRIKDMFISGGENVYPAEVENVLVSHPDLLEAAVVARPDPRWGEVGCAFVLPRPAHTPPTPAELTAFCRARLAAFKVPQQFVFVADFPRTAAGKIRKDQLSVARHEQ